jgi:phosphohistidine phosphatase
MEIILWRHAEAEPGEPDFDRVLTPKGQKQARKMAAWLDHTLPDRCKILVSPTRRTVQTAEAFGRKFKIIPGLAPGADARALLTIANWPDGREPVLLIGHQPSLGSLAALLLTGVQQDWPIRKAGAWWIVQKERSDNQTNYLKAVMTPELVLK